MTRNFYRCPDCGQFHEYDGERNTSATADSLGEVRVVREMMDAVGVLAAREDAGEPYAQEAHEAISNMFAQSLFAAVVDPAATTRVLNRTLRDLHWIETGSMRAPGRWA